MSPAVPVPIIAAEDGGALLSRRRGFTLVELMIVILVTGIIAVLSIPGFNHFRTSFELNGEAEHFAGALRAARSLAVMKNSRVVFMFDADENTYSYFEDADRDGICDAGEYRSGEYRLGARIDLAAYTFSSESVSFGSMGNAGQSGSITLRADASRIKTIRVFGGTGNIAIE